MKIKRLISFSSALLLSLSSLLVMSVPKAFAATATWDGGGADDNISTALNWVGDVAPSNGDSLVFDNTGLTTDATVNNDLGSRSFSLITLQGTGYVDFIIDGTAFTLTGGITSTSSGGGRLIVNTPLAISGSQTITMGSSTGLYLQGALSGAGNLTFAGSGGVNLVSNNSSYTGQITVSSGVTLSLLDVQGLGATSAGTVVNDGATLVLCTYANQTFAEPLSLAGNGVASGYGTSTPGGAIHAGACGGPGSANFTDTLTGAVTLTGNTKIAGVGNNTLKITGPLSGSYTIGVLEGQSVTLDVQSSNNTSQTPNGGQQSTSQTITYADNSPNTVITVTANQTAIVTGTYGSAVIASGGTLKGTGTVSSLSVYGKLAPGLSPGCINSGNLIFQSGSTYEFEVGGTTACTQYDQTKVTGTVALGNGTLSTVMFNNFKPATGQSFTIIDNDAADAVTGTFNNLAEGATFSAGGATFKISYVGGTGNDVVLTVTAGVPDTGIRLLTGNPIITLLGTSLAAGGILLLARRYNKFATKRS